MTLSEVNQAPLNFDSLVVEAVHTSIAEEFVLCKSRKRNIKLTPEEYVRQHWLHYLVMGNIYSPQLTAVEREFTINKRKKRFDILVFDTKGKPFVLFELKEPNVVINQKVFDQTFGYNLALQCPYLVLSNGVQHFMYAVDGKGGVQAILALPITR